MAGGGRSKPRCGEGALGEGGQAARGRVQRRQWGPKAHRGYERASGLWNTRSAGLQPTSGTRELCSFEKVSHPL